MEYLKAMATDVLEDIERTAREALGIEQLRPGQCDAIASVLEGRDTLVVMPTGAGKSAIYQIAGALLQGLTIVVSPLIALQQDQVAALDEGNAGEAALLNSTLKRAEQAETLKDLAEDRIQFLLLAPEQLANEETLIHLQAVDPALIVIDEAHCISAWGHDFRPEYLRLGAVIEQLGHPRVLALTATASPPVREEIVERLEMREPNIMVQGFDRPNIHLGVEGFSDADEKRAALIERVIAAPKPGIVYAATRKHTEEVAAALSAEQIKAVAYHAGMSADVREMAQDAFMAGDVDVIVATTAFGMGVDKPDVRFVYHLDISASLDAYYQEIGRAGRDGEPAEAILFNYPDDLNLQRFLAGSGHVDAEQIAQVAAEVQQADEPLTVEEISDKVDLSHLKITAAIHSLEDEGAVSMLPTGEITATASIPVVEAAEGAAEAQENRRAFERSRIEMMRGYADMRDCRREYLLSYFGESLPAPCQNCDNCDAGLVTVEVGRDLPFPLQSLVEHKEWGPGRVLRYSGETMVVLFDTVGYRTLALDLVLGKELLKQAA
jgi:ATP-dependent DNA helicase RecQ